MQIRVTKNIAYGRLQIDANDKDTNLIIWNFMSGRHFKSMLSVAEFGQFRDFAVTFEHVFLLFVHQHSSRILAFNSSKNVSLLYFKHIDNISTFRLSLSALEI